MKQKTLILFTILYFSLMQAATLSKIRSNAEPKNHRIVFDIDALKGFKTDKKNDQVTITVFDCDLNSAAAGVNVSSKFIQNFKVEESGTSIKISFKLPAEYKVKTFKIDQPDRIVLDVSASGYIQPPSMADPAAVNNTKQTKNNPATTKPKTADKKNQTPKQLTEEKKNLTENNIKSDIITIEDLANALKQQEYDKVITLATNLIKQRPANLQAYYHRSLANLENGKLEQNKAKKNRFFKSAVDDLNKVVIDSVAYVEGHAKIAEIYRLLGDENKAEEHYAIFMGNFQQPENSDGKDSSENNGKKLIPPENEAAADTLSTNSFFGKNMISNLFIYIISFLILVMTVLLWIRRRMNNRIYEEIEDSPVNDDNSQKDDLFEKLRPGKSVAKSRSSALFDSKIDETAFIKNESAVSDLKQTASKVNLATTEQDVLDKMMNERSEDEDYVSISLDDSTRDRIIELYDDGYTNREIAEQLKISYDEVNFIIRSLGESDNESKNKNKDVLNSKAGGISDSQNEETMQMKEIQDLYKQGVSIDELVIYFKKPKDEIEFIISLIPQKHDTEEAIPKQNSQSGFFPEDNQMNSEEDEADQLPYKIKELAEMGLSRRLIAEELKIGIDEVDFAAAMFKIGFTDSVVDIPAVTVDKTVSSDNDITADTLLSNPFTAPDTDKVISDPEFVNEEEVDEAMMLDEALNHEKQMAEKESTAEISTESYHLEQNPEDVIDQILQEESIHDEEQIDQEEIFSAEENLTNDTTSEIEPEKHPAEPSESAIINATQPSIQVTQPARPRIVTRDDIGIDLDNFLTTRSMNQDFGIAESRVFNFDKEEFKDRFASLPADDKDADFSDNGLEQMKKELQHQQSNRKKEIDNSDEDYFLHKSALRKQLAAEMKLEMLKSNEDVERKFDEIDSVLDNKLKTSEKPSLKYQEPELSKSFEDIINDYEPAPYTEESSSENSDDDLLLMRDVYKLLDQGEEIEAIAQKLSISADDVLIYQKIKSGNL